MRKKANFAKNFAKETGGYLKQYMGGGMAVSNGVPRKYANAELEGGEVIEKQTGPDVYVKGPSHENGGVPMRLQEGGPAQGGDYVWSDHLTYKGKTMAELYAMAIENGASEEEIDQLRMLQEQLAGRAGEPQDAKEIEEMPTGKNGGILKRYQTGTPFSNLLPEATVYSDKKPKYITANEAFPQESIEDQNFKLKPEDVNHGSPKNNNSQEAYGKRTFGEKMSDYAPEILAGASTVAPIIAAATVKNPYKDLKVPKGERVSVEKQFFERTDSRAEEAANQRGASLSKQLLQQAGFGPGEIAAMQKVELDRQAADAGARQRAREFNISQDRAEKQMNTELELRADMANQEMANKFAELEYNRQFGEAGFEAQRGTTLADYISGATRDAAAYAGDYRKMKAIYGETGIGERSRGYDAGKARKAIEKQNPYDSSKYNSVQDWNKYIDQLVREDSKRYNESKNKK